MHRLNLAVLVTILLAGCTAVSVQPVVSLDKDATVCIVQNPKVLVSDFISVVERRFAHHGVQTKLVNNSNQCEYTMDYTAERSWDLKPYLDYALLNLRHKGVLIGSAEYRNRGGLTFTKYAGTASKLNPVIDELLERRVLEGAKQDDTKMEPKL